MQEDKKIAVDLVVDLAKQSLLVSIHLTATAAAITAASIEACS